MENSGASSSVMQSSVPKLSGSTEFNKLQVYVFSALHIRIDILYEELPHLSIRIHNNSGLLLLQYIPRALSKENRILVTIMELEALSYIKSLPKKAAEVGAEESWYCIAACAFAACNQGRFVADIYRIAIESHQTNSEANKKVLRRIKEALLKTAVIYGIPRCINAGRALISAVPNPESNETESIRNHIKEPGTLEERGMDYMRNIFRADLDPFVTYMDNNWPDLRTLVCTFIYGYYQADTSIIDAITTSQINIATLIPMDVPAEVAWHMRGTIRNGGTEQQLQFASDIANASCQITNVLLKNRMPLPEEVINEERLIQV